MLFKSWNSRLSPEMTNEILRNLATVHISRINSTTEREHFTSSFATNNIRALCDHDPDYSLLSTGDALNSRQICAFYSKRADLDLGVDRRKAAERSFVESETLCRQTNTIFNHRAQGKFSFPLGVEPLLFRAQLKIARMLGDVPPLEDLRCRFGPGATTQVKKRIASPARKLGETLACSEDLIPLVKDILPDYPVWMDYLAKDHTSESWVVDLIVCPGQLRFVPKSYKTDRAIVVEPSLNSFVQLGVNDYLVDRFRRFGLDLSTQERNRSCAKEGSLTGDLATLDLKSASDTIATELVYDLLPRDWFLLLNQLRTSSVDCGGWTVKVDKFSSMGNGFTFPLESLIFYALACACVNEEEEHRVSVYGDDIIVPTSAAPELMRLLNCVGFVVNEKKSYWKGPFRESCGADFLRGIDIRPCYIKDSMALCDIFRLHNFYARGNDTECASILAELIPDTFKKWGPDGYGDGHLIGDGGLRPHGRDRGWAGFTFETYTLAPRRDFSVRPGDRVYPFYATYARERMASEPSPEAHLQGDTTSNWAPQSTYRNGFLGVSIPGSEGVNLIKIYTLSKRY